LFGLVLGHASVTMLDAPPDAAVRLAVGPLAADVPEVRRRGAAPADPKLRF
jgi:hypothetical protein